LAPAFSALMALAESEPKLMAEMLNTEAEYGCPRPPPMVMRKSCEAMLEGAIEWLIHS
jgi:hypothetical protein